MKLKRFAVAFAASVLLAGLVFSPDIGAAGDRGGGGKGGGAAKGGGGGSHAGGAVRGGGGGNHGGGRQMSAPRARGIRAVGGKSFRGYGGSRVARSRVRASRVRTSGGNKGHFAARRTSKGSKRLAATASRNRPSVVKNRAIDGAGRHSIKQLTSNRSLRQASFAKHNAFFDRSRFADKNRIGDDRHNRWRDRSGHWYGYRWSGPVFWPYAYGDYFSYALWPDDYSDTFWGYGPDAILWGTFWPYGEFASGAASEADGGIYSRDRRPKAATEAPVTAVAADVAETCAGFAPGVTDLPIQIFEKIADTSEDQRAALQELESASTKAADILKQSCSSETPLTPVARLDAMQRRLQAMQEATEAIRGPTVRFYGLLTGEQKQRLNALAGSNSKRSSKAARTSGMNIGVLCSSQAEFTNVPADEIAKTIKLDDAQKQELETLRAASAQASDGLKASCPSTAPDTVESRIDAAQKRVAALIQAVDTIRPAVRDFFASLTDEQKAALNVAAQSSKQAAN